MTEKRKKKLIDCSGVMIVETSFVCKLRSSSAPLDLAA